MNAQDSIEELPFQPTASFEEQRIAKTYAEALLNAAEKKGTVEEIKTELQELIQEVFRREPQFEAFLSSAAIGKSHKEAVLRKTFEGRVSDLFFDFLMVVNEHDRLGVLRSVQIAYNELHDQRNRKIPVQVVSAVPLSGDQTDALQALLHNTFKLEPILQATVDPRILGGLIVKVGDWLFDSSLRSRLITIRNHLMARSNYVIQSQRDRFSLTAGN